MKIKEIFSDFFNYILALGLALVFALFLSGRVGWFIIIAFMGAPVLSLFLTLPFLYLLDIKGNGKNEIKGKGEIWKISIETNNGFILPSPQIIIEMEKNIRLEGKGEKICLTLMPRAKKSFYVDFKTVICGRAEIRVKSVRIRDYLGLFTLPLTRVDIKDFAAFADILPDIHKMNEGDRVFADIESACVNADEGEDTEQSEKAVFGGFPGYDSRQYVPGDPIRRINWKLSARRGEMYVRLDDEVPVARICVVLDSYINLREMYGGKSNEKDEAKTEEKIIQHMLGIAEILCKTGNQITCRIREREGWAKYTVISDGDIDELRVALAGYSFSREKEERIPFGEISDGRENVVLICTPFIDSELKALAGSVGGKGEENFILYDANDGEVRENE